MKSLSLLTCEELALEYVHGNNRAFDELLRRVQSDVFSYILFIVQDRGAADDVFQNTFLKAITKLQEQKYVPSGKFNAWIIRIAHNAIMDYFRREKARHIVDYTDDDFAIAEMSDSQVMETSREDILANVQVLEDVKHLIEFLPIEQQKIVRMRYYEEIPYKEIAEITGCSINTCLGRMRYALINMRRLARENNIMLQMAL